MGSGIFYLGANTDLAEWRYPYGKFGEFVTGQALFGGATNDSYKSFFRFVNVTIPTGQVISTAILKLYASTGATGTTCRIRIAAEAADNPNAPTSASEADGLSLTSAHTDETPPAWTNNTEYDSLDISAVIQEIVSRGGWVSGNAIVITVKDNASDSNACRTAQYDTGNGRVPELYVEWAPPAPDTKVVPALSDIDTETAPSLLGLSLTIPIIYYISDEDTCEIPDYHPHFYFDTISDEVSFTDSLVLPISLTVFDSIFMVDDSLLSWMQLLTESLGIGDSLSEIWGLSVDDWLTLVDDSVTNWNGREIVSDPLNLYDLILAAQMYSESVNESLGITDLAIYRLIVTILENLNFTELVISINSFIESAIESLILVDELDHSYPISISDAFAAVDTVSIIGLYVGAIIESLAIADTSSSVRALNLSINEPISFVDTVSSNGYLFSAIYDLLTLNVDIELGDDIWECYVLNTPKFLPSMYSGFNFNSYCVFEDRTFGANDDGIYELTGSTDIGNRIHTGVIFSATDFGSPNQKRFRRGYLSLSGNSPMMIFETETGQREAYSIDIQGKVVSSSDLKSKKWKLSVADFDALDHIKLIPVLLSK